MGEDIIQALGNGPPGDLLVQGIVTNVLGPSDRHASGEATFSTYSWGHATKNRCSCLSPVRWIPRPSGTTLARVRSKYYCRLHLPQRRRQPMTSPPPAETIRQPVELCPGTTSSSSSSCCHCDPLDETGCQLPELCPGTTSSSSKCHWGSPGCHGTLRLGRTI